MSDRDRMIETIRVMAFEGHTLRSIGEALGGANRNTISGMATRAGIKLAAENWGRNMKKTAPPATPAAMVGSDTPWPGHRQCLWIEGDPRPVPHWCMARTAIGESYCAKHWRRVWNPVER